MHLLRLFILLSIITLNLGVSLSVQAETPFQPCTKSLSAPFDVWSSGWSREYKQQRIYSEKEVGLTAKDLNSLEPAWTFAFDGAVQPRSLPAITKQALFIGSEEGAIFALDTQTGCGYWRFQAEDQVRTAITIGEVAGRWLVFFGDNTATVSAVDALSGQLVWKRTVDELSFSVLTGSPVLYADNLYVPVSSWSVGLSLNPWGKCCQFRGSVSSLNALTGELNWQTYTITETPKLTGKNKFGGNQYGPSGAGVWNAPTIDEKRQRLYVGTGQNYSSPSTQTSDSVLAFDLHSGELLWSQQVLPEDGWNVACAFSWLHFNCPKENGKDYDIGAATILVTDTNGKDIILAGSKSSVAYAFDPDNNGKILWQKSLGRGGVSGGIHWGMAADKQYAYIPVADSQGKYLAETPPGQARPGLNKLDIKTGEVIWHSSTKNVCEGKEKQNCRNGISAAITGIPGAILAPTLDGILRAFSTDDGSLLWEFDSTQTVPSVNGIKGHGGTLDAGGVVATHGMLFFNSGYGGLISEGGNKGNVFWVLKKKEN